jgi:RNA polymerase II subunit A small phosphatase-like protein
MLATPPRPHAVRRESDTPSQSAAAPSSSADLAKTETSGGYTDISESDIPAGDDGEQLGEEHEYEEEYEDEEDRLIAQGGMGIPLDEVSWP